jgi:hypothetical protein
MTWKHVYPFSRHGSPELLQIRRLSLKRGRRECRVHAAPAVSCAKRCALGAHEHTGERKHSDIPCAMALRLTSCSPRRRIPFCHRRLRITTCLSPVGPTHLRKLDISNGCQDHTTSPYAATSIIASTSHLRPAEVLTEALKHRSSCTPSAAHEDQLALRYQARAMLPRPPHSHPNVQ